MAEQKGCHGGETKMVPRQLPVPVTHGDTGAKGGVRMHARMVGWSRIPGVPHNGGMAVEERAKTIRSRCKTRASHSTHAFGPRTSSRCSTFEACVLGGSSS